MKFRDEPGPVAFWRLKCAIEQLAAKHGLNGDMLDDSQPKIGTLGQQYLMLQIATELPGELTRALPTLSKTLVSRLVLSSTRTGERDAVVPPKNETKKLASPVASERNKAAWRLARGNKR